jgi:release factor glutamine methyltransferase
LITISQALNQSVETLKVVSETPNLDAQILLASTLETTRAWVVSHPEQRISADELSRFQSGIDSLEQGVPLPYIIGKWEFFGLEFFVTPDTLIPRPETELMVELALDSLGASEGHQLIADIGTGSGCIAVALANKTSSVSIIAYDISFSALIIARKNAMLHNVDERIHFLQSNLLSGSSIRFDIICANLPYISSKRLPALDIYGHEPEIALNGGKEGLDYIYQLLAISPAYAKPGGLLLIEIDSSQGEKVQTIAKNHFPSAEIDILKDLAHHDRIIRIQLPKTA